MTDKADVVHMAFAALEHAFVELRDGTPLKYRARCGEMLKVVEVLHASFIKNWNQQKMSTNE